MLYIFSICFFQESLTVWNTQIKNILRNVSRAVEKRRDHNKSKKNHEIPVPGEFIQLSKYLAVFNIRISYEESDGSQSDAEESDDNSYYIDSDSESVNSDDSEFWSESDWECESDWEETETEAEIEIDTEAEMETEEPTPKSMYKIYKQPYIAFRGPS